MEIILNEYSFDGQFSDCEEFLLYVNKELKKILDYLQENKFYLLKKNESYDLKVTSKDKLQDILVRGNGDPLVYQIKSYISQMAFCDPYWDNDIKTDLKAKYICPNQDDIPNCFSEAIERDKVVLSLKHPKYMEREIQFEKDGKRGIIDNIISFPNFLKWLLSQGIGIKYIFENYPFERKIKFHEVNGKCYALEAIEQNSLNENDRQIVLENIERLIDGLNNGQKNRFWDLIEKGLYEYRVSISENREFRLFFVQKDAICFLNGYVHKSAKTPDHVKNIAREIKRKMEL